MSEEAPPSPYDPTMVERYMDFRLFVDDALVAMGSTRGAFADSLKISRSMMSHVLNFHRKMNPIYAGAMSDFFQVDDQGRNLLGAMVDLDNDSVRARRSAWATLQAHQRYLAAGRPSTEVLKVLSSWWICAIYELASTPSFRPDPRWLAKTLIPEIDETDAQVALKSLLSAGMLVPDKEGRLRPVTDLQWTDSVLPRGEQSEAVLKLQRSIFGLAMDAPIRHAPGESHQSGSVVAIPASRYKAVVTRLRELEREVFHLATSVAEDAPERVYALSTQLFPLTGFASQTPVDEPSDEEEVDDDQSTDGPT